MLKRNILFLITAVGINSIAFAASDMADDQNMKMNKSDAKMI